MEVVFERTERRRYAIEIRRQGAPRLRMDPAPGFDEWFPHDLQHLIVEEQLGLMNGIFGRLAAGGTASTFGTAATDRPRDSRAAARQRRRLIKRDRSLAKGANDMARSERATYVAWHDWLAHSGDERLLAKAAEMAGQASSIVARMPDDERSVILAALPRLRARVVAVTDEWTSTGIGGSMTIIWSPVPTQRSDRCRT